MSFINRLLRELLYQLKKSKDNIAIICDQDRLTYRELDEMSDIVSCNLLKVSKKKNITVALFFERNINYIITLVAVIKSGIAFVPISREFIKERIDYIIGNSNANMVITNIDLEDQSLEIIHFNELIITGNGIAINDKAMEDDNAYVIYTSGSTGSPKGVPITYNALYNFYKSFPLEIGMCPNSRIMATTSFSFDISIMELIIPLLIGMEIVLISEKEFHSPRKICNSIKQYVPDFLQVTPTYINYLLAYSRNFDIFRNVKNIIVGGERFPDKLLTDLQKINGLMIYNAYGPTEATIWASVGNLTYSSYVHAGKAIKNMSIVLLGKEGNIVDEGEIAISGLGLMAGYYHFKGEEKNIFIDIEGKRYYRTGDMGYFDDEHNIIIKGRKDNQVKIYGHRIELEDVENCLTQNTDIKACVVVLFFGVLICYYETEKANLNVIKKQALKKISSYMIPKYFYKVKCIPVNANGKTDRKAIENMDCLRIKKEIFGVMEEMVSCELKADMPIESIFVSYDEYIKLLKRISKNFKVKLDIEKLKDDYFLTVNELSDYITHVVQENR